MAEILIEETTAQENTVEDSAKGRLEKFLRENDIKVFTEKDFDFPKDEKAQAKIPLKLMSLSRYVKNGGKKIENYCESVKNDSNR